MSTASSDFKSGYIAIVGRPNVGKSTLLNALVGQKISITTHKPQTTRHKILGIKTAEHYQMIFVDTPGFHLVETRAINRYMNRAALSALHDVDVVLFVVEAGRWKAEDQSLLEKVAGSRVPVIALVNKVDKVSDKKELLPYMAQLAGRFEFHSLLPVSARNREGLDRLEKMVGDCLPQAPAYFDAEQVTDKSQRFLAAEIIREKLFLALQQELPYSLTVEIESFSEEPQINNISAVIWVEKNSHKGMVIGKQGAGLKSVGQSARKAMENLFEKKVFLQLWVKVKSDWSDDERALRSLGYQE
ncbi:MAG TPA: GTPase Era [Gammaproteobacteria bacterium]